MNAKRVRAAEGVIFAAQKTKLTAAGIAASLEATGMLQSPESAAELVALRARVTELEAAATAVRGQHYEVDGTFDEAGSCIQCGSNYPCATVQALSTEAPDPCRPCGCPKRFARHADGCPTTAEDPHDSPLHHTYAVCRDLPEVTA